MLVRISSPLDEEAATAVSGSLTDKFSVFDNKTFMMHHVSCPTEAFEYTFQPDPIDCGENIKLYRESHAWECSSREDKCLQNHSQ